MASVGRLIAVGFGAAGAALLGYSHFSATYTLSVAPVAAPEQATPEFSAPAVAIPLPPSTSPDIAPAPPALTPATVAQLVEETAGDDAGKRASAIDALAAAPEVEAVPVLQKLLGSGGDIDRQLALSSLHALALRQGDADGSIRESLRQAIYDGGDEAVASGAQAALEDIERDAKTPDVQPQVMNP